jgi:hypothetical protein
MWCKCGQKLWCFRGEIVGEFWAEFVAKTGRKLGVYEADFGEISGHL